MKKLIVLLLMFLPFAGVVNAQEVKIAFVNTQEIFMALPETKDAQQKIEQLNNDYKKELETMNGEYQRRRRTRAAKPGTELHIKPPPHA